MYTPSPNALRLPNPSFNKSEHLLSPLLPLPQEASQVQALTAPLLSSRYKVYRPCSLPFLAGKYSCPCLSLRPVPPAFCAPRTSHETESDKCGQKIEGSPLPFGSASAPSAILAPAALATTGCRPGSVWWGGDFASPPLPGVVKILQPPWTHCRSRDPRPPCGSKAASGVGLRPPPFHSLGLQPPVTQLPLPPGPGGAGGMNPLLQLAKNDLL